MWRLVRSAECMPQTALQGALLAADAAGAGTDGMAGLLLPKLRSGV